MQAAHIKANTTFVFSDGTEQNTAAKNAGVLYKYNSTISPINAAAGEFRFDSVTLSQASLLSINITDANSNNLQTFIESWDDSTTDNNKGTLYFHNKTNYEHGLLLTLTRLTPSVDGQTFRNFNITSVTVFGSAPQNGDNFKITFSATGDLGAQGSTGNQGGPGPTGAQGSNGSTGAQGSVGSNGSTGAQGATGSTGARGIEGAQGATGSNGFDANSRTWNYNQNGSIGSGDFNYNNELTIFSISNTDAKGNNMNQWLLNIKIGDYLIIRKVNNANDFGIQKITTIELEPPENTFQFGITLIAHNGNPLVTGDQLFVGYVPIGSTGAQGATGSTGATGSQGIKGDQGGTGAQGVKGTTGAQGAKGEQGATGNQGGTGAQGAKGDQGTTGAQGVKGTAGSNGSTGAQGAKGDQGATGARGIEGAQGATGNQGETGAQGVKGAAGSNGSTGAQGVKGDQGTTGAQGVKGAAGSNGSTGAQGAKGDQGATGAQGVKGAAGSNGSTGAQGVKGDQGTTGAQGVKGAAGSNGSTGAQGAKGDQGATGARGIEGAQGATGNQGGTGAQGVKGAAGSNGSTGAQGVKGDQGDTGNQGGTGAQGATGDQGTTGARGIEGAQGATGAQGVKGAAGSNGSTGAQGVKGAAGSNGSTGAQGAKGDQGNQGNTGATGAQGAAGGFTTNSNAQIRSLGVGTAASGTRGEIRTTDNITAFYSSDINLKENLVKIGESLNKIKNISGYNFDWKDKYIEERGGEDGFFIKKHDVGLIAQEVEKILPEVVCKRPDGYKGVRYELVIPLLVESIKELNNKIEILESKIK